MSNIPGQATAGSSVVVKGPIGPFDPVFHKTVGRYFRNSPTEQQKECLKQFFESLRGAEVDIPHLYKDGYLLVYTCEHVITFSDDGKHVVDLAPQL